MMGIGTAARKLPSKVALDGLHVFAFKGLSQSHKKRVTGSIEMKLPLCPFYNDMLHIQRPLPSQS
jgi:hypothetical protein